MKGRNSALGETRTHDQPLRRGGLYPLSPPRRGLRRPEEENGALGETRTHDLSLRRAALYPLSYERVKGVCAPYCNQIWCRRGDLNPHARYGHCALNAARLPFRHFGICLAPGLPAGVRNAGRTVKLTTRAGTFSIRLNREMEGEHAAEAVDDVESVADDRQAGGRGEKRA